MLSHIKAIHLNKFAKLFLMFAFVLLTGSYMKTISQSKNAGGIIVGAENTVGHTVMMNVYGKKTTQSETNPVLGISYERRFGKHHGLEMALKFRAASSRILFPIAYGTNSTALVDYTVREHFISLPVLYKIHTPVMNVSVGPSVDYFYTYEGDYNNTVYVSSFDPFLTHKFSIGGIASVSKSIMIEKKLMLEPSLYYNSIFSFNRTYYGLLLGAKYRW